MTVAMGIIWRKRRTHCAALSSWFGIFVSLTLAWGDAALFDLSVDPFEKTDQSSNLKYASALAELEAKMDTFKHSEEVADVEQFIVVGRWKKAGGVVPWVGDTDLPPIPERPKTNSLSDAPNVVFILADDVGSNDVNYQNGGSTWLPFATPNIDRLAADGIKLTNHYSHWICSPTRAALMTGRYAIRIGFSTVPTGGSALNLPLGETTLAQEMQHLGYKTALVGKWHLGCQSWQYTPTYRGFDRYYGYYSGSVGYYSKKRSASFLDLHDQEALVVDPIELSPATHLTLLLQDKVEAIIGDHAATYSTTSQPLFLYYSPQSAHTGGSEGFQAPAEYLSKCKYATSSQREQYAAYCALIILFDETVGRTVCALEKSGLGENSLMVVTTDNGGWVQVPGSNYPFRGSKGSMMQGSINTFAFIYGSIIPAEARGSTFQGLVHISDWFPTLLGLASKGSWKALANNSTIIDGFDVFHAMVTGAESPRTEIFHNYNRNSGGGAMQVGKLKMVVGDTAPTLQLAASFVRPQMSVLTCSLPPRLPAPSPSPTSAPTPAPTSSPTPLPFSTPTPMPEQIVAQAPSPVPTLFRRRFALTQGPTPAPTTFVPDFQALFGTNYSSYSHSYSYSN